MNIGWISLTRVLAIVFVVMLHSAAFYYNNFNAANYGWLVGNAGNALSRWAVPVFVMISGALLLGNNKTSDYKVFYKKRFVKILIPLLVWSVFYTLIWFYQNPETATLTEGLQNIISGHPYYHMWFLYMILGLYAFTPIFNKIISIIDKKEALYVIIGLFILSSISITQKYLTNSSEPLWVYWFIQFIPYYFSGYYLSKTPINIDLRVSLGFSLICALSIFIASYYMSITYDKTQYFYEPLSPLVIFMSLSVFVSLMKWESVFSNSLANLSLGVYLIHPFFLLAFFKIFKSFSLSQPLIGFISSWILCTIMSFALIYILKKIPFVRSCA